MRSKKKVILALVVLGLLVGGWFTYAVKQQREANEVWKHAEEREEKMQW